MAVRVAQHYAQAVGTPDQSIGELRVRRLYIDVLIQSPGVTHNKSASSTMSLTQGAIGNNSSKYPVASSAMSLVQTGEATGWFVMEGVNSLGLVSSASAVRDLPVTASSIMALTSLGGLTLVAAPETDMFLVSLATHFNYVADREPVGNVMVLTQDVELAANKFVGHVLDLVQTVDIDFPIKPNVEQVLGLAHHVSTPYHFWVSDDLNLTQVLPTPLPPQFVTHTMNLVDETPIGLFEDVLSFTQTVAVSFSLTAASVMEMEDSLVLQAIWIRGAEHENVVGHALTWYEDTPCNRKHYRPFQGENTIPLDVAAPRDTLQDPQGDTGNFSLYQPYLGIPVSKVTLRKPELDNRDRNAATRISRETRGGKIIVYADPTWPNVRTLAVTIVGLTETQVDNLQSFMQSTVGQEIGLTDWEGRLWKGFIPNPNEPAVQDGRSMWTVSFEFQGEALDVEQPGNEDGNGMAMDLSQSVTAVIV